MTSFILLLTYILFNYFRPSDFIPSLSAVPYMKILAGLLFLCIILERGKIDFFTRLPQNRLLAIIIAFMLLSVPFAFHRPYCFFGTINFCKVVLCFIAFLNLVDNLRSIRLVMWTILISTVYILYEVVNIYMANQYEARYDATHSGIWDANDLAAFLVTTIPLIIALFQLCRPLILKILLLGGLVSYLLGIVATQSRGGFIGILAVGTCYIIKSKRKLLSLTLVGVLAVAMYAVMPESPLERFFSISISERQSGDSIDERIEAWKRGLSMGKDHPLFGVGVGCFSTALGTVYHLTSNPDRWITAHNSFILILAEVGIPAFLCYLGIYYLNFKDLRIIRRHLNNEHIAPEVKKEVSILSNTFGISLIAFAVTGFFLSHTYTLDMFLIMAFIIVLKRITERLAYEHQPQNVSG